MRRPATRATAALAAALAAVLAACTGGGDGAADEPPGETLRVAVDGDLGCADWLAPCADEQWGPWLSALTLPRAFDPVRQDDGTWGYVPNALLDGEPELVTEPRQLVVYHLRDDVTWDDGEPIVCQDLAYTWDQVATADRVPDRTGYVDVEDVECPDDQTAIVTFARPYAGWRQLFGGRYGILPSHILEGQDRSTAMAAGFDFSGGPWTIAAWAGDHVTLVANDDYWGERPQLAGIDLRTLPGAAGLDALRAGDVDLTVPDPQPDIVEQVAAGIDGAATVVEPGSATLEALWMNGTRPPFDSLVVRQAFAHAIDRDAVAAQVLGGLGVEGAPDSTLPPVASRYADPDAFARYPRDLARVAELMEGAGWARGPDGVWQFAGQPFAVELVTASGDAHRDLVAQAVVAQAAEAGFVVVEVTVDADPLFHDVLPSGEFQLGLYEEASASPEPELCAVFCAFSIPSEANDGLGRNWTRAVLPDVDPALIDADRTLDDEARIDAYRRVDRILAEDALVLPIAALPLVVVHGVGLEGEVTANPLLGPLWNAGSWRLPHR